ncbi:hypothetical protein LCGC14_1009420 [marine sediment metagenome]|uniref:DUF8033 domain-containing protein n=1 Tax=marine sediment metagenome TaxID=412755 RepID=A0A0F9R6U1_9ZZZZ|nr:hypothetical protein [Candidatus Aminicenantes bacterium]
MKVRNMISSRSGKAVANQFIIQDIDPINSRIKVEYFQSYDTTIVMRKMSGIKLDRDNWDYSVTTGRYRNQFLGETKRRPKKRSTPASMSLLILINCNGESMKQCKHPPKRLFIWWVGEILCICCCECGAVLKGGAK